MKEVKDLKKTWKKLRKPLIEFFNNGLVLFILVSILSLIIFLYLDFALRYVIRDYFIGYGLIEAPPFLFTISIFIIFTIVMSLLKKKGKIILFNCYFGFFFLFFLVNYFYFKFLGRAISLSDLSLVSEGAEQVTSLFSQIKWELILSTILFVLFMIACNKMLKNLEMSRPTKLILLIAILVFVVFRVLGFVALGPKLESGKMRTMVTPKNIYCDYDDGTRAMKVSGVPEYMWKFVYVAAKNKITEPSKSEQKKKADTLIKENPYSHTDNKYTGIYKNKNVIYIMMESMDNFLVTKEIMPTLYGLQAEGFNFSNRYAPTTFGAGKTFSTEFAMMTGMYQPNEENAAYTYANNTFTYSFPKMFRELGYTANSIHYNDGNYYNRENMHLSIGFEHHYNYLNKKYKKNFKLFDTELVNTDETYKEIAPDNKKFATLITTMSGHLPYGNNGACTTLVNKYPQYKIEGDEETSCLYAKAHETDEFIRLLLKRLNQDKKLDDTVLVFVTDHQAYGYSLLNEVKGTKDANLITNVPFVIWNNDTKGKQVSTILDTADILPILANMFSLNYSPVYSTGTDVFSKEHENYVFFKGGSWYDGNINYKPGETKYAKEDAAYVEKITKQVNTKIEINNLILDSDYYSKK